ncbi:hypothetical protein AVEN_81367-1 [Araneus ventricosus]|uniref:Uncharacterized protein n=1 Tax=Araneus ventricosus TaxID=182803 RepID=A0A4Y2B908_ARAVE|nr:hypothetical protein AVEN_81367-1 [Araneus ventricosus]
MQAVSEANDQKQGKQLQEEARCQTRCELKTTPDREPSVPCFQIIPARDRMTSKDFVIIRPACVSRSFGRMGLNLPVSRLELQTPPTRLEVSSILVFSDNPQYPKIHLYHRYSRAEYPKTIQLPSHLFCYKITEKYLTFPITRAAERRNPNALSDFPDGKKHSTHPPHHVFIKHPLVP